MKQSLTLLFSISVVISTFSKSVFALDCTKAASKIDKIICSSSAIRKADNAMSKAYLALLLSINDNIFKDALINSQRRWLKVRNSQDDDVERYDNSPGGFEGVVERQTVERQRWLESREGGIPMAVERMSRQRRLLDLHPGKLAGFEADCFIPFPPFGYGDYQCMPIIALQNQDRLCRHETSWASGHETEVYTVARVESDKVELVATCKEGYAQGPECPRSEKRSPDEGWTHTAGIDTPSIADLSKRVKQLDPDVNPKIDGTMGACLTKAEFPPATDFVHDKR